MDQEPDYNKIGVEFSMNRVEPPLNSELNLLLHTEYPLREVGVRRLAELGITTPLINGIYTVRLTRQQVLDLSSEPWVICLQPSRQIPPPRPFGPF